MASFTVVMRQPVGVHIQGSARLRVAAPATGSRALVSLPTMLGGQINVASRDSWVGQGIPAKRRIVRVTESRTVTESQAETRGKKAVAQRTIISPNLAKKWRQVAGSTNWEGMLDPLDAELRTEIIRYGDFIQPIYDSFDGDEYSKYQGSCRHNKATFLERGGLPDSGYKVTKFLYTTTDIRSLILFKEEDEKENEKEDEWNRSSNWAGYIAVCTDEKRIKQLGRRDIVVVWRGTLEKVEWAANLKLNLTPSSLDDRETSDGWFNPSVAMEKGFLSLYTSSNPKLQYNKLSAREQLLAEINRLIETYDNETLSITTTGHSLGAALAIISAYDIAESGINRHNDSPPVPKQWGQKTAEPTRTSSPADTMKVNAVPITVMSFGGPRVGNTPFAKRVEELGVKVLRVQNVNDFVTKVPGFVLPFISEQWDFLDKVIEKLPWTYSHCGVELQLNNEHSPYLSPMDSYSTIGNRHNLQVHLHLVAGHQGTGKEFKLQVQRDPALVNKTSSALKESMKIPPCWFQLQNKGLVLNDDFEYVLSERNKVDIPILD